jgi:uncharacterized membrane protein (DUF106 family)
MQIIQLGFNLFFAVLGSFLSVILTKFLIQNGKQIRRLGEEMIQLREEMREGMKQMREEMKQMREEMKQMREEMREGFLLLSKQHETMIKILQEIAKK